MDRNIALMILHGIF